MGTSLLVQWLRLPSSHCRGPSSIPGQGTRSHMLQLKIPSECSQINKINFSFFFLKTPVFGLLGLILHEARTSHELLLPWWLRRQRLCSQCRRPRINPWVRRIPWRRKWQPTPVFLPGKSHGQRSLVGYSPWGCKGFRHGWACMPAFTVAAGDSVEVVGKTEEIWHSAVTEGVLKSPAFIL